MGLGWGAVGSYRWRSLGYGVWIVGANIKVSIRRARECICILTSCVWAIYSQRVRVSIRGLLGACIYIHYLCSVYEWVLVREFLRFGVRFYA